MFDDYQALILFSVDFQHTHGFLPKLLYTVAAQHDEYKLIFEHLVTAADLLLFSHLQYRVLTVFGNLFLVALVFLYWKNFFQDHPLNRRLILFAPVSYLILQLNYAETVDWAMSGLQMLPVIVFALAAISCLVAPIRHRTTLACLFAFLSCLSSANGFILGPVGILLLLQQRRLRALFPWCLSLCVAFAMYLYHYNSNVVYDYLIPNPSITQRLHFLAMFTGGAVENMHHFPIPGAATMIGAIILITAAVAVRMGYYRAQPFAFYSALWLLISAMGVAWIRVRLGMEQSLAPRYKLYSDLLLVFAYTFGVWQISRSRLSLPVRRRLYAGSLAFAVLLNLSSNFFGYKFLKRRAEASAQGFRLYLADPLHLSPEVSITGEPIKGGEPEFSRKVLNQAIAEGIYIPPAHP